MDANTRNVGPRFFFGIILIVVGILYFLQSTDLIDYRVSHIIFSLPFWAFLFGCHLLMNTGKKLLGAIFFFGGGIFLLGRIFPTFHVDGDVIFPLIIITIGVYIIFKHRNSTQTFWKKENINIDQDTIDDVAIFGGGTKVFNSNNFRGGNITAIFGGSEIDLKSCQLAEGTSIIEVLTIFGGTTIIVPSEWNIRLNVTPLFGGFSNKVRRDPNLAVDLNRTLEIRGVAIFGGGEIKSY